MAIIQEQEDSSLYPIDRKELVDISTVHIDIQKPKAERLSDYLEQIRDPYHFLCGGVVVHIAFSETDKTIEDRLEQFIRQRQAADHVPV